MSANIQFTGRTVGDILNDIRAIDESNAKGKRFEELFRALAPYVPEWEVKEIWRWADWPNSRKNEFSAADIGVDLVAELNDGSLVAIQCKCYAETYRVSRNDIRNFITAAAPKIFDLRWFVATCDYGPNARTIIKKQKIRTIEFNEYHHFRLTEQPQKLREPRKLQQEAIEKVLEGFEKSGRDRGQLIMACGTGKTFTSMRIAEKIAPKKAAILFIAPSIALVSQSRREWLRHTARKLACTVICSDDTAARNEEDTGATEITSEVTTDPERIAQLLAVQIPAEAARVVFCTYQSLEKLSDAQQNYDAPKFDLAIVDEAHRTTGYLDEKRAGLFQMIHDPDKINADKRLYMTATPRVYQNKNARNENAEEQVQIVDMNDAEVYGTEFYRLTFKKAVEADMLCDYRVIALGITEDSMDAELIDTLQELSNSIAGRGNAADTQSFLALGAIVLAINGIVKGRNSPGVLERTIVYASNIRRSKWLVKALENTTLNDWASEADIVKTNAPIAIAAKHLDGTSSAWERNTALNELNYCASEERAQLISNAKLFTEGVDVPALNAIAFLDPRRSKVDTIQAVGRVMRRDDESKKVLGYIIVPVIFPPEADLLDTLNEDQSRFKSLGAVLRALQSHDERLYTELGTRLLFGNIRPGHEPARPIPNGDYEPLQSSFMEQHALQGVYAQIAKKVGISKQGDILAQLITNAIEDAARAFMQADVAGVIAKVIGTPAHNEEESCKTAALLIANACIMHRRLEETGNLKKLPPIVNANLVDDPASALMFAWIAILDKDYEPVFQDACALLKELPKEKLIFSAIITLIKCATDNATTLNELGFDHAGPLYHRVLGSAQSDGAYYTKNLSAYLLAGLAFDENFTDWSNSKKVNKLKIIDPACGTGTLLMAALNIIKKRAAQAQKLDEDGINKLHKKLVENSIYGFDINKYSVQLAACNLTMGAPNTDYERMNLKTLLHGPVENTAGDTPHDVRHGALELLLDTKGKTRVGEIAMPPPPLFGEGISRKEVTEVVMPKAFDVVIYNPPFTETENQGLKFSEQTKLAMRERLQSIKADLTTRDPAAASAIARRSIQPFFTPLANGLLSEDNGKLAKIIPATLCTAENARAQRKYLADNFHIEMVVTSHDPKRINFSENTSIHECLVIGKRSENKSKPTRFIQLVKYPDDVKAAERLIEKIHNGEGGDLYSETLWPADKVRAGDWTPVQWFNPNLARTAGEIDALPKLIEAEHVCPVNNNPVTVRVNFDYDARNRSIEHGAVDGNMFCTIAESVMQTIQAKPETKATPRNNRQRQAASILEKATRLLIAMRFRTTSSRLFAIHSKKPALGSTYFSMKVKTPEEEKAVVVFLNSSFGILQMLNRRTSKLDYPSYEIGHLQTLMLPDPDKADLAPLLAAFEKIKNTPLERLAKCAQDPARKILDHAAANALGVDPAITDQWREWLSQEPTITNKPYQPHQPQTLQ